MIQKGIAAAIVVTMCAIAFSQTNDPAKSDKPVPKGQRVFICGHSFHMPVAGLLPEIVKSAGITDQKPVGQQRMSGSTVMQHWKLADDQKTLKKALLAGEVDVPTLSPTAPLSASQGNLCHGVRSWSRERRGSEAKCAGKAELHGWQHYPRRLSLSPLIPNM
jgi:hypothetical protein